MPRKFAMLAALSCLFAASVLAQGLNTQASKDDWEEINFEFNSAVLSDGYPSLLRLADLLHKNTGYHVRIEGNTDNIGNDRSNEKLGLARANTVRDFLVKYGANASQIEVSTRGKRDPKYPGYKPRYTKTDVARWMNRRVVVTVTDANGKTVSDGSVADAIKTITPTPGMSQQCCDDILKRLDAITALLKDMQDQNAGLRREIDGLKNQEAALENKINNAPKPLTEAQTAQVVDTRLERFRDPRFTLLGLNAGLDQNRDLTFTGSGRFFAPFKEHFAIQIQGEYMFYKNQREGQADIGLVDRIGNFQGGVFASFKSVSLKGAGNTGTLGQGSAVFDYIFRYGKVGIFGTKGFMTSSVLDRQHATFTDGGGNTVIAPNVFLERYLQIVDQVGIQETIALWRDSYMEANYGYLHGLGQGRSGGTLRFVFPLSRRVALTLEGGVNETLIARNTNTGRAQIGFQFGNFTRPKEFINVDHAVPMQVPRVRYEVLSRRVQSGVSPPIADAGPDQIGVPAGPITLNGSASRDPNGEALTYQWVQEAGPAVALAGANQPIATFTAAAGQAYSFRLTVRNTDGQQAAARVRVTTQALQTVEILFFNANPTDIAIGQASTLSWRVLNATTVNITPGIGNVNPTNGSVSVSPTDTTTYRLTATNANSTQSSTVTVTVRKPQPQIAVCTATPMNINQGESATLFYNTINADTVNITPGVGSVGKNGSVVVSPAATTTYTITATNQFGSDTCTVSVKVTPGNMPRIIKFSAAPLTIPAGSTSTLLWLVDNADTVTIDQGVGTVDRAGTKDVTPATTTTYTLTAKNAFGSVTAQVTINVTQPPLAPVPPTITSFTAAPPTSPNPGSPVVLSCKASNASRVVISGVGVVDANGNLTVNPQATTTYVCVAVGPTGLQASANLTVPVTTTVTGGTTGPTIVINSPNANCLAPAVQAGTTVCETVVRSVNLDLSGSSSPNGGLTFSVVPRNISSAVINGTTTTPTVQLSELFGDYFFDVTVTDAKGLSSTATVDIRLVVTRVR